MRKSVEVPTRLDLLHLQNHVPVASPGRGSDDVFIKRKRDKNNKQKQIYNCANRAHSLRSKAEVSWHPRALAHSRNSHISGFLGLAISLPFSPAFMKTGPSHLIRLNVAAYAIPLNAIEAIKGSPSPWKVLTITPREAPTRTRRLQVSFRDNVAD